MSLLATAQLTAIATAALAVFAIIAAVVAFLAFRKQSQELEDQRNVNAEQTRVLRLQAEELRASLDARQQVSLELRYQYASTIVAWQDEPESSGMGWLVVAHVQNTGSRPVRDVSARWYADGAPVRDREQLTVFLPPGGQKNFDCRVDGATVMAGVKAIVQFRTVGEGWWSAGTDGGLAGGMEVADAPVLPSGER